MSKFYLALYSCFIALSVHAAEMSSPRSSADKQLLEKIRSALQVVLGELGCTEQLPEFMHEPLVASPRKLVSFAKHEIHFLHDIPIALQTARNRYTLFPEDFAQKLQKLPASKNKTTLENRFLMAMIAQDIGLTFSKRTGDAAVYIIEGHHQSKENLLESPRKKIQALLRKT